MNTSMSKLRTHLLTDEPVETVVSLRFSAIDHVPVIADEHALLKECRIGTQVIVLTALLIAHVICLTVGFDVGVIACRSAAT